VTVFGPLIPDRQVELAVLSRIEPWAATYLNEVCRQNDRDVGSLPTPRAWKRVSRFPTSVYAIRIPLSVGVLVSARDDEAARTLASDYGVALAAATLHKAPDHPLISQVSWRGYRNDDGPGQDRMLATSIHVFWVTVEGVLDAGGGPLQTDPDPDPEHIYPDYGQVQTVEIIGDITDTTDVTDIPEDT
jgi:hypothetical protein